MAQNYARQFIAGNAGVNNTLVDEQIADNELADARNYIPNVKGLGGGLVKRCGVKAKSNGSTYTSVTAWGTLPSIYCGQNGDYYQEYYAAGATNVFNIYAVANGAVLNTSNNTDWPEKGWCSFMTFDIYSDGVQALKTSNGTAFTAVTNFPAGYRAVAAYNNYLFTINDNSLRWSDESNCQVWNAAHELLFELADRQDKLISIRKFGDVLAVFSKKRIFLVQGFGDLDFTVARTITGAGASSHDTTVSTPFGLFFWNDLYGICRFDGERLDFPMWRKLASTLQTYNAWTQKYGSAIWRADRQCVSFYAHSSAGQYNADLRIDYYPAIDAFYLHSGAGAAAAKAAYNDGITTSYAAAYAGASVYLLSTDYTANTGKLYCRVEDETLYTDIGSGFTSYALTKRMTDQSPGSFKTMTEGILTSKLVSGANLTYQNYIDNAVAASNTKTIGAGANTTDYRFGLTVQHKKIQHYVSDALTQRVEIHSLTEIGSLDKL